MNNKAIIEFGFRRILRTPSEICRILHILRKDGRPSRKNKAAFSNFSGVVWKGLITLQEQEKETCVYQRFQSSLSFSASSPCRFPFKQSITSNSPIYYE